MDLSESLREELKTPLGELIKDSNSDKEQIIKKIYSEKIVVTVGDATSELLIKMGLIPFLQIVDGKEKRHDRDLPTSDSVVTTMNCKNPPGQKTEQSIDIIKKSLKIFDNIVVAISDSNQKNQLFTTEERIEIVSKALFLSLIHI